MNNRRKLVPFWVTLLFGSMSFFNLSAKPDFATIRTVDVVQLLGIGMCFGVALATLVVFFLGRRASSPEQHL